MRKKRKKKILNEIDSTWVPTGRDICMQMHLWIVLTLLRWRVTFRINYRQQESRAPETFIDTLLCVYGHTPGIMGLPGPLQPLFRLFALPAARVGPHFMLVMPLFPESVYYHRPVSSFMQNNLISRASKNRYNVAPCARVLLSPVFVLSHRSVSRLFLPSFRFQIDRARKLRRFRS